MSEKLEKIVRIKNDDYPIFNVVDLKKEGEDTIIEYVTKKGEKRRRTVKTALIEQIDEPIDN